MEFISQLRGCRYYPHCYLNFGWLSFFCTLSRFHSSRFSLLSALSFLLSTFFFPFYITGKAFVYLLLFYIFYDVCVAICFLAYATKILGLAVSYFPFALIIIVGTVLIFFYICLSSHFFYCSLSFRYQISAYTYIRRLFDHSFCYSVIAACYSTFRWDPCISERFLMKFYDANYTEYYSLALQIQLIPSGREHFLVFSLLWGAVSLTSR